MGGGGGGGGGGGEGGGVWVFFGGGGGGGGGGGDVDKRAVLVPFLLRVGREAGGVLVWEVNEDKQEW